MSTTFLRARLTGLFVVLALSLSFTFPAPASAQASDPPSKLDAVLQERTSLSGRSRVIVEFADAPDVHVINGRRGRALRSLAAGRAQVAEVDNAELPALADDPRVARVMVDRPVFPTAARTAAATGAALAHQQFGVTGRGVGVVVIDSGVTPWHNDLYLVDGVTRTHGPIVHFKDFTRESGAAADTPSDEYGHGTHVAGIIAGSGFDSGGARRGIAPGAHLAVLKVLNAEGHGYISDVIAAIDYAIVTKNVLNTRVINLSVASGVFESYRHDPLAQAAQRAVDAGIVVVAAAGNLGLTEDGEVQFGGITSPGNSPAVLTVGAASHQGTARRSDDVVGGFSSRGPTWIDFVAKPDVVAPGVGIESTIDPNSVLARTYAEYLLPGTHHVGYQPYLSLSGTSMAAPVVSGAVALMLEANPSLTPNAVKAILQYTAQSRDGESPLAQGAGFINIAGAIRLARAFSAPQGDLMPSDVIEGEVVPWSRHIIWGNHRVTGGIPLANANAWTLGLTWGATSVGKDAVVWGIRTGVSETPGAGNPTGRVDASAGRGNIVWATAGRGNIVWATGGRGNIVWATEGAENVVWGQECGGQDCRNRIWGADEDATLWTAQDGDVSGTTSRRNIVWATNGRRNIVWATAGRGNIVWATAGRGNIVWATNGRRNIVWATGGRSNIVWATAGRGNIVWATGLGDEELVWTSAAPELVIWPAGTR